MTERRQITLESNLRDHLQTEIEPSAGFTDEVMRRIDRDAQTSTWRDVLPAAAAAAAVMLVAISVGDLSNDGLLTDSLTYLRENLLTIWGSVVVSTLATLLVCIYSLRLSRGG